MPKKPKKQSEDDSLPEDLLLKIQQTFPDPEIQLKVIKSMEELHQINVGRNQLRRGIVFLANGDYDRFRMLRGTYLGDPRDLLVKANSMLENKDYWFGTSFDDMGPLKNSGAE